MKKKAKLYVGIFIGVIVLIVIVLYSMGYRIKENWTLGKMGMIEMILPLKDTLIIIDQNEKIITSIENETVNIPLSPKSHEIIISKDGYYPWMKKFTVPSDDTIKLDPLFVSQNASGAVITNNDQDYWVIKNQIESITLPTKENPRISSDGKIHLWIEDNTVLIKEEEKLHTVMQSETKIRSAEFYKNRTDVIIVATSNGVFALETDTENFQNFMPIYKGVEPYFSLHNDNSIYIIDKQSEDKDLLMEVVI